MRVLILGAGGFIGRRLAKELLNKGGLDRGEIAQLVLVDVAFPDERFRDTRVKYLEGDFSEDVTIGNILREPPDIIYHLAAVVSGEAEKNFEIGMKINFLASYKLLEFCRKLAICPTIVFASSCAVFGGDVSKMITDDTAPKPRSSYGTEKAMVELLMNDYSRRGFVDGRTLRLPTIAVRPGKPNAATSSFISGIIREPLNGLRATCPVPKESKFWILSPQRLIQNMVHAANLEQQMLGDDRIINLPGLTVSVIEMVEALREIAGRKATDLITYEPDAFVQRIVLSWPPHFKTERGDKLGFVRDESVSAVIRAYMEEERIRVD